MSAFIVSLRLTPGGWSLNPYLLIWMPFFYISCDLQISVISITIN